MAKTQATSDERKPDVIAEVSGYVEGKPVETGIMTSPIDGSEPLPKFERKARIINPMGVEETIPVLGSMAQWNNVKDSLEVEGYFSAEGNRVFWSPRLASASSSASAWKAAPAAAPTAAPAAAPALDPAVLQALAAALAAQG